MARLTGKRALIVGVAPDNLGEAIARRFAEEGAQLMLAGRREEALQQSAAALGAHSQICDITQEGDVTALVAAAVDTLGGLDVAVNATGWGLLKPFEENTREELEQMAQVQFIGPFQLLQQLVKAMREGGSIIQISSVTATIMFDNHAAYMGTKAGLDHVIRCVAHEYGERGIRANSLSPGGIADTPMSAGGLNLPAVRDLYTREIPLGRPGLAQDVADAALWLASDESAFVTGQNIQVSGGQTLRRNPSMQEVMQAFEES